MDLSKLKSIETVEVAGKRVLVRADLNVPMRDCKVSDDTRLVRLLPTLENLRKRGAVVLLVSHFGRPKGQIKPEFTLQPVAAHLRELATDTDVEFIETWDVAELQKRLADRPAGSVTVLENLRFDPGEEANAPDFVKKISSVADIYVNDAFSASHRAHASIAGIPDHLPAFAGPLLMAEINALQSALGQPKRPVAALVGGAKVSTKIPVLSHLMEKVDVLIIGGGMANTFLFAKGYEVGTSLCEKDFKDTALEILTRAEQLKTRIVLPSDVVVAEAFAEGSQHAVCDSADAPDDKMILDVGPQSLALLTGLLSDCETILWNGPLGAFEITPFGEGTIQFAREVARQTRERGLISVAGGGDTVAALNAAGVTDQFSYVSTAGGAFLEWLEGRELPGIVALIRN
ncbi:MAG: phosphoglycerate kinase [Methyloligellaceae bacterium]